MTNSVYSINKGISRPIEFKGLKAQYIGYLGGGLFLLLLLFTVLYLAGISPVYCLLVVLLLGACLFLGVYRLSNRYGEHGMMKQQASRRLPRVIKARTRKLFF